MERCGSGKKNVDSQTKVATSEVQDMQDSGKMCYLRSAANITSGGRTAVRNVMTAGEHLQHLSRLGE